LNAEGKFAFGVFFSANAVSLVFGADGADGKELAKNTQDTL